MSLCSLKADIIITRNHSRLSGIKKRKQKQSQKHKESYYVCTVGPGTT